MNVSGCGLPAPCASVRKAARMRSAAQRDLEGCPRERGMTQDGGSTAEALGERVVMLTSPFELSGPARAGLRYPFAS